MKEVIYTDHLNLRLSLRNIPTNYPEKIFENPEQIFLILLKKGM